MDKFRKYNAFFIGFGFVCIAFIQQFYYAEWRGIYVGFGFILAILIDIVFEWKREKKAVK